jgi:hypothetical protein
MRCLNVPPQEDMRNRPPVTAEEARAKRAAERKARIKNAAAKKQRRQKLGTLPQQQQSQARLRL